MPRNSKRLLKALIVTTIALTLVHLLLKYISVVVFQEQHGAIFELSNRFDLNDENSVPQWFTQTLFLSVGLGSFLAAYMQSAKPARRLWIIIGSLSVLMSLDDAATLHEFVLGVLHVSILGENAEASLANNAWIFLIPFVLLLGAWLAWRAYKILPTRTTKLLVLAGTTFLLGAVFFDSLANTVPARSFMDQGVFAGIEGGLELLGMSIAVYAVADYLESHYGGVISSAVAKLRAGRNIKIKR